jgi:hypothetical protein
VAEVTAEQVRRVRAEGYRAGYNLAPVSPNPYAPPHVPVWKGPRTAAERAEAERAERGPRLLAAVWRRGYRDGLDAYAKQHDLPLPSDLL